MLKTSSDGKKRCFGGQAGKAFYADYHDQEWGIPVHDEQKLFEMLILEGAQAGLSWETVLRKRAAYRMAFHDFQVDKVAAMSDAELEACLENPGIIRNRRKVLATRSNAFVFQAIQQEWGSFDAYLWRFVNGKPIVNHWRQFKDVPTRTPISDAISKDLKKRGMSFAGSTIIYAFMQAVGMVDDHLADCWKRQE
ncbi:MAG: DNA-3-methyladenine glycosylase I [Proteobacteria bacterium]|nr:MAG: DNA-3-methyladenine glycosylase I [Pseudomonadota bacterium]